MCKNHITLQPDGLVFHGIRSETILQAAIRHGVGLPYGCRDGACGACKCRLLQGQVEHGSHQASALSEAERNDGFVLACRSVALTDLVIQSKRAFNGSVPTVRKLVARVTSLKRASADVMEVSLTLPPGTFDHYRAGQYLDVLLQDGSRRSYSMANAPGDSSRADLHIRHMPGGRFTDHVFGTMKVREILRIEGPHGSFFLRDGSKPIVLLASGTGFAPIQALLQQMHSTGSNRLASLYWGGRWPADLYRGDWIKAQLALWPALRYAPVLSQLTRKDGWDGRTGLVHQAVADDFPDLSGHQVYACGAPAMVQSARANLIERCNLSPDDFFADAFLSAMDKA